MFGKLQAFAILHVSEETEFEIDTTAITLSYLYHFGTVNKKLFSYCKSPEY